jgi:hypothetical protein
VWFRIIAFRNFYFRTGWLSSAKCNSLRLRLRNAALIKMSITLIWSRFRLLPSERTATDGEGLSTMIDTVRHQAWNPMDGIAAKYLLENRLGQLQSMHVPSTLKASPVARNFQSRAYRRPHT